MFFFFFIFIPIALFPYYRDIPPLIWFNLVKVTFSLAQVLHTHVHACTQKHMLSHLHTFTFVLIPTPMPIYTPIPLHTNTPHLS